MESEKEKMLNGELYDADDPELVAERERARGLVEGCMDPDDYIVNLLAELNCEAEVKRTECPE